MDAETFEIREHMGHYAPFDVLSEDLLDTLVASVQVAYFRAGSEILKLDEEISDLHYIRSGAVEISRRNGELYNRLMEGDIFGQFSLRSRRRVRYPATALEDTLIYYIPGTVFETLCEQDDNFAEFVEIDGPRLKSAVDQQRRENDLLITRARKLIRRSPVMVFTDDTLQHAARQMADQNVSSVLVVKSSTADSSRSFQHSDGEYYRLCGVITEQDFCTRVVAEAMPADTAVGKMMMEKLVVIQSDESVSEAMLTMLRHNVHHLPVLHRNRPIGILRLSDIVRYETHSSLYLVSSLFNQTNLNSMVLLAQEIASAFSRMVREGANSHMIGSALSTIGRSYCRRLLEMAEEQLGPAPVPYCFMVMGSMARGELTMMTDQDNALILSDDYREEEHGEYFESLARFVCDGLASCGYRYCKGDIMATNPKWRQPLKQWIHYYRSWIADPKPEHLLHSSIFFDMDAVQGEEHYVDVLQQLIASSAPKSPLFLAAMARNALGRTPPLGFFRTFVLEQDGKHRRSINLKRRGTAPLVDLIRVHAMACGSLSTNSFDRLDDIAGTRVLPEGAGERLRYAMEFISMVRIRHQYLNLESGEEPDNNIDPENVSDAERHNLKDAFQILSNAQKFLEFRYPIPRGR